MKILIVSQYFWPENFRINDLAQHLVERGHEITVLTGKPNYPEGRFFDGYSMLSSSRDDFDGIPVRRVPLIPRGKGGAIRLALNYASFAFYASCLIPFFCRDKYDAILAYEPSPITVALPAIVLRRLKKIPAAIWLLDLWPETLEATGAIKSKRILSMVGVLVRFIYRNLDLLLVQSEAFRPHIKSQSESFDQKIRYFPASAEALFEPQPPANHILNIDKAPGEFWLMFAGNVGVSQDPETIVGAAELLKDERNIKWVIVGDGRKLEWMKQQAVSLGISDRFHFLGRHPVEKMPEFFAAADVMLVTLKNEPIFALTIPGRIQSYLACGKPMVATLPGEGARIIEESGAGVVCNPEDPEDLAAKVRALYSQSRESLVTMGKQGRSYYEQHFDRDMLTEKLESWLDSLSKNGTA